MTTQGVPTAGYKFNAMQEIRSHSSILFNERMAYLFMMLDLHSVNLNANNNIQELLHVRALLKQLYKNFRMVMRYNQTMRASLNLETKDEGIYVPDVVMGTIDRMVEYCSSYGYTEKRIYIITQELNNMEMMLKDILQYFHYFVRPDFRQKPDIEMATERYKEMADKSTVEELRNLVGKRHKIDFDNLGTSRIEVNKREELTFAEEDEEDEGSLVGFDKKRDLDEADKDSKRDMYA